METGIKTDLQIFVTQKKTDAYNKAYYVTFRNGGVSYNKRYATKELLAAELVWLRLLDSTWVIVTNVPHGIPIETPVTLSDGETSIPDDEDLRTVLSFCVIAASLQYTGTQAVILAILKGASIGDQTISLTLASNQNVNDLTTQIL